MAIELNLTPEDIDQLVRDSLMKAGFGKLIESNVQKALQSGYDNPIDKAMKAYVTEVADELIRTKFTVQIREAVNKLMEQMVTQELLNKVTGAVVKKMVDAASDRY
jgi:hypothetical protein